MPVIAIDVIGIVALQHFQDDELVKNSRRETVKKKIVIIDYLLRLLLYLSKNIKLFEY